RTVQHGSAVLPSIKHGGNRGGDPIPEGLHRVLIGIRVHWVRRVSFPERLMVDVFYRPMNSTYLTGHLGYRIQFARFHFGRRPHIDHGGNAVIDHLLPTTSVDPFKSPHSPQVLSDLPRIAGPGPVCWMKILHC